MSFGNFIYSTMFHFVSVLNVRHMVGTEVVTKAVDDSTDQKKERVNAIIVYLLAAISPTSNDKSQ